MSKSPLRLPFFSQRLFFQVCRSLNQVPYQRSDCTIFSATSWKASWIITTSLVTVELVRRNLYAALISFIHLMRSWSHDNKASQKGDANMFAMSISQSTIGDNLAFSGSESLLPSKPGESIVSALELGGLAVLKPVIDRLVTTIARDAIDGTEVWKTMAFVLLDAIVQLSSLEKRHVVLSALTRHGVLSNLCEVSMTPILVSNLSWNSIQVSLLPASTLIISEPRSLKMISTLFMFTKPRCHSSFKWASLDLVRNASSRSSYSQFPLNAIIRTQDLKLINHS